MAYGKGNAYLDGRPFRLDPTSISWEFKVKTVDFPTIGGKVVQVYGSEITDMTVTGAFGIGGWDEQEVFLRNMKALAKTQVTQGQGTFSAPKRLSWPSQNWDFQVYLSAYKGSDGGYGSIEIQPGIFAPTWSLTFFIVEDNLDLKKIAADVFISRIAAGVGWKQSEYNGPMTLEEAQAALVSSHGAGLSGFEEEFTLYAAQAGAGAASPGGGSSGTSSGETLSAIRLASVVKAAGLSGEAGAIAIAIALAESSGNSMAHNAVPPDNSYGLWQINMLGSMGPQRRSQLNIASNDALFDPDTNARAMMMISSNGSNWRPWSTYTNGAYEKYMATARDAMRVGS